MFATHLRCRDCQAQYDLKMMYACPKCGGLLEVEYDQANLLNPEHILHPDSDFYGLWKFHRMLPLKDTKNIVSLGEGDTPILRADRISQTWELPIDLYLKAEMLNPSGSFKDRPSTMAVSMAKELGHKAVVVASSGNASAAVASYAARAGIQCIVFIPKSTDPGKIVQAQSYGAKVFAVDGTFSDAYDMSMKCAVEYDFPNCTSTYVNPYTVEANKTVAYEIFYQLKGNVPDYITVPIGTGPLLAGTFKGFEELLAMGLITKLPKMIGVQAQQCMPIVRAFTDGSPVLAWQEPIHTIAGGIADPLDGYTKDGETTLKVIDLCSGAMVSLTEEEIKKSTDAVEQLIGLYSEPTGAVSVGAVEKLFHENVIPAGSSVVCLVTGHGFKFTKRSFSSPSVIHTLTDLTF
ncbi:threonine synthase [Youxingia wuxianensis]|uniref:Threonine synthase n=1 Tax=Youxingia wuxianensis TaxID=2763678 RepID=A0A926ER37_9FIRM|nr:threonine synthase [Youxingia wuxianensis]MBC8584755.1 threonine synthase [Youxingia wuxianensis]